MRLSRISAFAALAIIAFASNLMAQTVHNIGSTQIIANVEKDSPGVTLSAKTTSVTIQLVDTNGQWTTTAGHIIQWGVQRSTDGGATWQWGPVWQGDPNDSSTWITFGTFGKGGQMPILFIGTSDLVANQGDLLRLAILTDANIKLGATITTTP